MPPRPEGVPVCRRSLCGRDAQGREAGSPWVCGERQQEGQPGWEVWGAQLALHTGQQSPGGGGVAAWI